MSQEQQIQPKQTQFAKPKTHDQLNREWANEGVNYDSELRSWRTQPGALGLTPVEYLNRNFEAYGANTRAKPEAAFEQSMQGVREDAAKLSGNSKERVDQIRKDAINARWNASWKAAETPEQKQWIIDHWRRGDIVPPVMAAGFPRLRGWTLSQISRPSDSRSLVTGLFHSGPGRSYANAAQGKYELWPNFYDRDEALGAWLEEAYGHLGQNAMHPAFNIFTGQRQHADDVLRSVGSYEAEAHENLRLLSLAKLFGGWKLNSSQTDITPVEFTDWRQVYDPNTRIKFNSQSSSATSLGTLYNNLLTYRARLTEALKANPSQAVQAKLDRINGYIQNFERWHDEVWPQVSQNNRPPSYRQLWNDTNEAAAHV